MAHDGTKTVELEEISERESSEREKPVTLSKRQRHIVWLLMRGHTSGDIATMLDTNEKTVDNHRASLGKTLCAYNTLHAVMKTLRLGFVELNPNPKVIAKYEAKLKPSTEKPKKIKKPAPLTDHERHIVWLLMRGYTSGQIAKMLDTDAKAVDNYRAGLIKAFAKNTLNAVMKLLWWGLIELNTDPKVIAKWTRRG